MCVCEKKNVGIMENTGLVSTKEQDFLNQDPHIRGQRYACISFVSPEEVLANKDAFVMQKFMRGIATDIDMCLSNLTAIFGKDSSAVETVRLVRERHSYLWSPEDMQSEFNSFRSVREIELDEDFRKTHGVFRTSIRGFKIRGVYDSLEDAKSRAKNVKNFDDKFHVYIAEVGCWCPWSPNPDTIAEFEYSETQLNTLMSNYNQCQESREELYNARKKDLIDKMANDKELWLDKQRKHVVVVTGEEEVVVTGEEEVVVNGEEEVVVNGEEEVVVNGEEEVVVNGEEEVVVNGEEEVVVNGEEEVVVNGEEEVVVNGEEEYLTTV
jgi:hypothetical protein